MVESTRDVVLFGLSLALPIGLFGLRQSLSRFPPASDSDHLSTVFSSLAVLKTALLKTGSIALLSGLVMGLTALPAIAHVVDDGALLLIAFVSAWCGFTVGCGIDLRVLRKTSSVLLSAQLGQCIVALTAIPLLMLGLAHLPWTLETALFSPVALLIAIGMCLSDDVMEPHDRDHWQRTAGVHKSIPKTSVAACVAILLASLGAGHDVLGSTHMAGVSFLPVASFTLTIAGTGERVFCGLVMGCVAGLLSDLAAKDNAPTGVTFGVLAGVLLLISGMALAFGIQPLMVGVMAGAWVINATLRRLDVHHVIAKSSNLSSTGVPFVLGWTIGYGAGVYGISPKGFLVGLCLILAMRPIVRVAGWRLGEYLIKARNPPVLSRQGESVLFDNSGFVIALVLTITISGAAGVSFLAAAVVSQLIFVLISMWWPRPAAETRSAP